MTGPRNMNSEQREHLAREGRRLLMEGASGAEVAKALGLSNAQKVYSWRSTGFFGKGLPPAKMGGARYYEEKPKVNVRYVNHDGDEEKDGPMDNANEVETTPAGDPKVIVIVTSLSSLSSVLGTLR